jgi:hypothetical protein
MNILISTTTNHNCGDDFIRIGAKNILKHIFPFTPNYIHYDRNPNNMVSWPQNQNISEGLHGTFMNNPIDWKKIDLVVLAGSPEFLHHPLAPIYEGLINHPEIPLLAIGVGYSEPEFVLPLTIAEKEVLVRPSTLIITRQKELTYRIYRETGKPSYCLPCPALFCLETFPEKTKGTITPYQIAHSLEEITEHTFFSSDPYDMLNHIGEHEFVISNRLHGAIAGISSGAVVTLENDSFRAQSAIELFSEVMQGTKQKIYEFKNKTLNQYLSILKQHYAITYSRK